MLGKYKDLEKSLIRPALPGDADCRQSNFVGGLFNASDMKENSGVAASVGSFLWSAWPRSSGKRLTESLPL